MKRAHSKRLLAGAKRLLRDAPRMACARLPLGGVSRPVFIVGCGRSGTTILGHALSQHPCVKYLNEPRHLWLLAYPETDIWTTRAAQRNSRLTLTAADVDPARTRILKRLFRLEMILGRSSVLVEKLPANSFRLEFIHRMFPEARFVHIYRNGLEVARSIQRQNESGSWFAANPYKWEQLVEHERDRRGAESLSHLCQTYFDKGLLEWRLSTEAVVAFLDTLPDDAFLEIPYADLVDDPPGTVSQVLGFIGLEAEPAVTDYAARSVARKTNALEHRSLSEREHLIGGPLLALSMRTRRGLSERRE